MQRFSFIRIFGRVKSTVVLKDSDFTKASKIGYLVTVLMLACPFFIITTGIRQSKVDFATQYEYIRTHTYIAVDYDNLLKKVLHKAAVSFFLVSTSGGHNQSQQLNQTLGQILKYNCI